MTRIGDDEFAELYALGVPVKLLCRLTGATPGAVEWRRKKGGLRRRMPKPDRAAQRRTRVERIKAGIAAHPSFPLVQLDLRQEAM